MKLNIEKGGISLEVSTDDIATGVAMVKKALASDAFAHVAQTLIPLLHGWRMRRAATPAEVS